MVPVPCLIIGGVSGGNGVAHDASANASILGSMADIQRPGLSHGVIHTSHLQEVTHMDDDGTWNFNRCDYWQPGWSSTMSFINKTGLSEELVVKADGMVRC